MNKKYDLVFRCGVILCLVLIFLNALRFELKKQDYFFDEKCSIYIANSHVMDFGTFADIIRNNDLYEAVDKINEYMLPVSDQKYSLQEIEAIMDASKGYRFDYLSTLIHDFGDSHPPFYYLLLHTVNSVLPFLSIKGAGFFINIIALILSCLFIYLSAKMVTDRGCALICTLFYGLSFDFINNVTFMRMYGLMTLFFMVLLYLHFSLSEKEFKNEDKILTTICVVEFFAMYTQFFAAIFIIPLFVLTIVFYRRNGISIKQYVKKQVITAVFYLLIWPFSIFQVIFDESGSDVRNNLSFSGFMIKIHDYLFLLRKSLFSGSYVLLYGALVSVFLFAIAFLLIKAKEGTLTEFVRSEKFEKILYLIISGGMYYLIIVKISPWAADRYVMPATPILSMIFIMTFWGIFSMIFRRKDIPCFLILVFVILVFARSTRLAPYYLYPASEERLEFEDKYGDSTAIIVDADLDEEFTDVFLSIAHPFFIRTHESDLDKLCENTLNDGGKYTVYINTLADSDHVLKVFEEQGYTLKKCSYEKIFYMVYAIQ
ncbi:MAG: glycosyltransferase family 39 protein [Butyrivibrio sp.]|nr:glycosyltransferase family 39 protein [Butyrivibrio sp.]